MIAGTSLAQQREGGEAPEAEGPAQPRAPVPQRQPAKGRMPFGQRRGVGYILVTVGGGSGGGNSGDSSEVLTQCPWLYIPAPNDNLGLLSLQ
mmetsp:Transcript_23405/g.43053  ORF Transcript_23405/g.43053 Transcript_23405/m.43053 type:complete len:92 (+) Transcript_23405:542-817(+)